MKFEIKKFAQILQGNWSAAVDLTCCRPRVAYDIWVGAEEPTPSIELLTVFSAEGPILSVGQDQKVASAEARPIFASLAAAPFFAANSQKLEQRPLRRKP